MYIRFVHSNFLARTTAILLGLAVLSVMSACSKDPQQMRDKFLSSGEAYVKQAKPAEAIIEFRNAVQADPLSADARIKLAETFLNVGNIQGATAEFVRAADLREKDADLQVNAGAFLLMLGRAEDAADRARRALKVNPRHVRAEILLSGALANLKDFGGALTAINKAIELEPSAAQSYAALGALRLGHGQVSEAETALRRAVTLDPKSVTVRLSLARFLVLSGRPTDAEAEFRAALALAPREAGTNRALVSFLVTQGRVSEAEPYLRTIADVNPAPDAKLMLADFYASTKRPQLARDLLLPLAADQSSFAPANVRLAALEYEAGQTSSAHARLRAVLARSRTDATALALSAEFLLREEKLDEALTAATSAVEGDSDQWRLHVLLGRVYAARRDTATAISEYIEALRLQPNNLTLMHELARLHLSMGHIDRAVGFAEDAINAGSNNPQTRLILVRALLGRRDLKRAGEELATLRTQAPDLPAVHVEQGILAGLRGNYGESRASFERALALEPGNTDAFSGLAAVDVSEKRPELARARAAHWVEAHPNESYALLAAARVASGSGDRKLAEQWLRRVIEIDAANFAAYVALGQVYMADGRLDEARREFDAVAERSPQPVAALTMAGSILYAQNRPDEARKRYERALQFDSRAAVAANNLAWIYAESGERLDTALQLAQMAKTQLGDSTQVLDTLGWVYLKKELPALALPLFQQNATREPRNASFHHHLGLAYARLGDVARARVAFERALELDPSVAGARSDLAALTARAGSPRTQ